MNFCKRSASRLGFPRAVLYFLLGLSLGSANAFGSISWKVSALRIEVLEGISTYESSATIVNSGSSLVEVDAIEVSCSCIRFPHQKFTLHPGEEVSIKFDIAADDPGVYKYKAAILADGKVQDLLTLTVSRLEKLVVSPNVILINPQESESLVDFWFYSNGNVTIDSLTLIGERELLQMKPSRSSVRRGVVVGVNERSNAVAPLTVYATLSDGTEVVKVIPVQWVEGKLAR